MLQNSMICKVITIVLAIVLVSTNASTFAAVYSGEDADLLEIKLKSTSDIDVVLTLGKINVNAKNFEADIKSSLRSKGIDTDKVNISAIETKEENVDKSSAQKIFSEWKNFTINGNNSTKDDFYIDEGRLVRSNSGNTRPAQGYYFNNPSAYKIKDATYEFVWGIDSKNHGSFTHGEAGFLFRMQDEKNYYAYLMDNHSLCGNIRLDGGEAIVKVTDGKFEILEQNDFPMYYEGQKEDIKIVTKDSNIKVYRNGKLRLNVDDSTYDSGTHGFYVWDQYGAYFSNISLTTQKIRKFKQVIREPEWRNGSKRFIVNLEDKIIPEFNDSTVLGEIITRLINEEIYYVGWGTSQNKKQFVDFIKKNNEKGAFFYNSNYNSSVEDIAEYIANQVKTEEENGNQYILIGEPIDIEVNPPYLAKNTANTEYPQGRWKIDHDYKYFHNSMGQASWTNQWQDDLIFMFDKPGKYEIWFENKHPVPRYIYVHRRPIADFNISTKREGKEYAIKIQDFSYDSDCEFNKDKGIIEKELKWKETSEIQWHKGLPSKLPLDKDYIIQLRVKDYQGIWSLPQSKYISTKSEVPIQPVASFTFSPNPISMYEELNISDTSYDPVGNDIIDKEWIVQKEGTGQIWKDSVPLTNFKEHGVGKYSISLRIKNSKNLWSETFRRQLIVIEDKEKPNLEITLSTEEPTNQDIIIAVKANDIRSGIREIILPDSSKVKNDVAEFIAKENGVYKFKVIDRAGNISEKEIMITNIDKEKPVLELMVDKTEPTNQDVIVTVKVSDAGSDVKEIILPDETKINEESTTYTVTENGSYKFKVVDKAGNEAEKEIMITNIDKEKPVLELMVDKTEPTNQDVIVTVKVSDAGSDVKEIILPDETKVNKESTTYTVTENGSYKFKVVDKAGNEAEKEIMIANIDKEKPVLELTPDKIEPTNQDVIVTVKVSDVGSDVKEIILPDGTKVNKESTTYTATKNGSYTFKVIDKAGNEAEKEIIITNIDRTLPTKGEITIVAIDEEERIIKTIQKKDLGLGVQIATALEIPGYKLISTPVITIWLKPADNVKKVTFEYKLDPKWKGWKEAEKAVGETEKKVKESEKYPSRESEEEAKKKIDEVKEIVKKLPESKKKDKLNEKLDELQKRLNKIVIPKKELKDNENDVDNEIEAIINKSKTNEPQIKNILPKEFIARWKGHEAISEKPIYIKKEKKAKIEISEKETLIKKGLTPRFYKWNEEKEKWVAMATRENKNNIETYKKVEGYVAAFAVKQPKFSDIKGNEWYAEKIDKANGLAIIEGYKDKDGNVVLKPHDEVSRSELYAIVGRLFGAVPRGQISLYKELDYIIEGEGGNWYKPYLEEFKDKEIIDEVFNEEQAREDITRLEVVELLTTMLERVEDVEYIDLSKFKDTKKIDNIRIAKIIDGYEDGTLKLNDKITRAEALTLIINTLEKLGW